MRKWLCALLVLLLAGFAPAEANDGKTLEELLAERTRIDEEIARLQRDEEIISKAIDTLKENWKQRHQDVGCGNGHLEIRSTRVFYIADPILPEAGETAQKLFGDMVCFVEFILLTDLYETAPYYLNAGAYDCVALYRDGSYKVIYNPLNAYRSRTYQSDFSGFISGVSDRGSEYNAVFQLSKG